MIASTYKVIWPMALTLVLVYAQNIVCFPGMILNGNWYFLTNDNPWRAVIVVGSWNTCEAIGRYAPSFCSRKLPPKWFVSLLAVFKCGLVYCTLLCVERYNGESTFFMSLPV